MPPPPKKNPRSATTVIYAIIEIFTAEFFSVSTLDKKDKIHPLQCI